MNRTSLLCLLFVVAVAGCNPFDAFDAAITYERMTDQENLRQYETRMPQVVPLAVPTNGGENQYFLAQPGTLENPIAPSQASIQRGVLCYGYFCIQCHGSTYNGEGTVGQSFSPLPADLGSSVVQELNDDNLFRSIAYGYGRHPPLAYTVSVEDRWHLINWIRSLGVREESKDVSPSGDYPRSVKAIP